MGPTTQVRSITASSPHTLSGRAQPSSLGNDLETTYARQNRQMRLDAAEERSLSGAMVGLCAGWMAAGGAGALVGLALGAILPIWQDR